MSVPCLAQAGKLTGERRYYDDAAKQILQFSERMFVKDKGLYMHAWVQGMQHHPAFHWARANGWAIMATVELLEVLPEDHPARATHPRAVSRARRRAHRRAGSRGTAGISCSTGASRTRRPRRARCSCSRSRAASTAAGSTALAFGPAVSLGWNAVARKVNAKGQVEGTCVGTGVGWDPMFYMYRPVHVLAAHGYGPVLLAGAEMIELRRGNPTSACTTAACSSARPWRTRGSGSFSTEPSSTSLGADP